MFMPSASRMAASALPKGTKRLISRRFVHCRYSVANTTPSSYTVLPLDWRNREEEQRTGSVQRAMPCYIPASGLVMPQLRRLSTGDTDRPSIPERIKRASVRQRVMDRASNMRESARDSYNEFKEHPRQSMQAGAKSFSGMLRRYGPVFVGTYAGVYFTTLGTLFACVQSGVLDPAYLFSFFGHVDAGETKNTVDLVVDWMKDHSLTEPYAPFMEKNPYLANLAVAWIAVKFTEPIRAAAALALTPRVARTLGYSIPKTEEDGGDEEPVDEEGERSKESDKAGDSKKN